MACNCKSAKRIDNLLEPLKRDEIGVFSRISNICFGVLTKLLVTILIIVLIPFVAIILIWNYLFKGGLVFRMPKFMTNYIKKRKNE